MAIAKKNKLIISIIAVLAVILLLVIKIKSFPGSTSGGPRDKAHGCYINAFQN